MLLITRYHKIPYISIGEILVHWKFVWKFFSTITPTKSFNTDKRQHLHKKSERKGPISYTVHTGFAI